MREDPGESAGVTQAGFVEAGPVLNSCSSLHLPTGMVVDGVLRGVVSIRQTMLTRQSGEDRSDNNAGPHSFKFRYLISDWRSKRLVRVFSRGFCFRSSTNAPAMPFCLDISNSN